jgi:ABC-type taurine transport system ATPase subunit
VILYGVDQLLASVKIETFRSLRELSLDGLGRVNLLVGGSNSGKTSVLEALAILGAPQNPLTWLQTANRREPSPFAAMSSSKVDRLKYLFPLLGESTFGEISIRLSGTCSLVAMHATMREMIGIRPLRAVPEADDDDPNEPSETPGEVERAGLEVSVHIETSQLPLFSEDVSSFEIWEQEGIAVKERGAHRFPVRVLMPYEHWLRAPSVQAFSKLGLEDRGHEVVDLLRELEPNIVDVSVFATQREPLIYLKDRRSGFIPLNSFGDGMRRAIAIALSVSRAKGGILLIDEIETGLHYTLLGKLYAWLVRACIVNGVQLFVTTHSIEAVDALLAADIDAAEETVAYRLVEGKVHRLGEDRLRRLRSERGLDIR